MSRNIPSVDELARWLDDGSIPRPLLVGIARRATEAARAAELGADARSLASDLLAALRSSRLATVINAAGVLLHTNLGRAPWSEDAVAAASVAAAAYGNVEFDLRSGDRGRRGGYVNALLTELTGAPASLVVNNNAAAVFLTLFALGAGRPVPVSRGELIEIGGSYRLPDLMAASGVIPVEVGTTNRTRISDYRSAAARDTALLLKVHPSNYRIGGFTEEAAVADLVDLAAETGAPFVYDVGSGLLDAATPWLSEHPPAWLAGEPGVRQSIEAGVDLVLFSGDKLLGGPQAGIIVGRADLVERLRTSPVARAMRVDAVTLAGLAATLEAYASGKVGDIPFWRMATRTFDSLARRAAAVIETSAVACTVVEGGSVVGAGSVPGMEIPGPLIGLPGNADEVYRRLLRHNPPVLARRVRGTVMVDLRAVDPSQDRMLAAAIGAACTGSDAAGLGAMDRGGGRESNPPGTDQIPHRC